VWKRWKTAKPVAITAFFSKKFYKKRSGKNGEKERLFLVFNRYVESSLKKVKTL